MQSEVLQLNIEGVKGAQKLSPDNFDITDLAEVLDSIIKLYSVKKKDRPDVVLKDITKGSVNLSFKSTLQHTVQTVALLGLILENPTLAGIDPEYAEIIEQIQQNSKKTGYTYSFGYPGEKPVCVISPNTSFKREEPIWVNAEFYFYGVIQDVGGKTKANIHIDTKDYGSLKINTTKEYLGGREDNLLYHTCGIRATGKQELFSGEIDGDSLQLVELLDYSPTFDREYIRRLVNEATPILSQIPDKQEWLNELRGR